MEIIELVSNNVKTTLIKTTKFKTINISIVFLGEFSKENATKRALLPKLLSVSSNKYLTKKSMANKLYDLYDASFSVISYPSYKTNITDFNISFVNPMYLYNTNNLVCEVLEFLKEVIFNPHIENDAFTSKNLKEQKQLLKDNIKNIYNNKSRYALRQLLENMSRDEIFSISSTGTIEELEQINEVDLYNMYKEMINKEHVCIFITGDFNNDEMLECFKIFGDFKENQKPSLTNSEEEITIDKVKEIIEKQNVNQAKLLMGFRSNVNIKNPKFIASLLFNTMFGGMFSSDLMKVVRQEHSLSYYIASQILNTIKLFIVSAGIDQKEYNMVSNLVIKQLELYKEGNINNELLIMAKDYMVNELTEVEDNPYQLTSYSLRNYLHDIDISIDKAIDMVKNTSLDDIIDVAKGIQLDTCFLLAGEDYDN